MFLGYTLKKKKVDANQQLDDCLFSYFRCCWKQLTFTKTVNVAFPRGIIWGGFHSRTLCVRSAKKWLERPKNDLLSLISMREPLFKWRMSKRYTCTRRLGIKKLETVFAYNRRVWHSDRCLSRWCIFVEINSTSTTPQTECLSVMVEMLQRKESWRKSDRVFNISSRHWHSQDSVGMSRRERQIKDGFDRWATLWSEKGEDEYTNSAYWANWERNDVEKHSLSWMKTVDVSSLYQCECRSPARFATSAHEGVSQEDGTGKEREDLTIFLPWSPSHRSKTSHWRVLFFRVKKKHVHMLYGMFFRHVESSFAILSPSDRTLTQHITSPLGDGWLELISLLSWLFCFSTVSWSLLKEKHFALTTRESNF